MPGCEISARGRIGRRRLGLSPRTQLDRRHLRFLVPVDQQRGAVIELIRYIEQMLGKIALRHVRQEHATDAQMDVGTVLIGNQRIGRLLDPVVQKFVAVVLAKDEPSLNGGPKRPVDSLFCLPMNQGQDGDRHHIAQAGKLFQDFLGGGRQHRFSFSRP